MKKFQTFYLTLLLVVGFITIPANVEAKKAEVIPQMTTILLNDVPFEAAVYNINGSNYFQLRELAQILADETSKFNIGWDAKNKVIQIIKKEKYSFDYPTYYYEKYRPYNVSYNQTKLSVDGKIYTMKAYTIDGNTYFQLRELASILNFELGYDGKVVIKTEAIPGVYPLSILAEGENNLKLGVHPRWSEQIHEFIIKNNDGTISLVEAGKEIIITTYDQSYKKISEKKLPLELPIFGTFFSGETYNYISYGVTNEEQSNKEVIRIVKYDKNFNRISAASVYGNEAITTVPFDASSGGRMAEYGDTLAYHTSRERYTSADGLNHQSQLTIEINTNTMQVTNELEAFQWNHVSHSFDQYVLMNDDGIPVYLDHGDAYPRSLVLNKKKTNYTDDYGTEYDGDSEYYYDYFYDDSDDFSFFEISGSTGANVTGVSVGGFEQSDSHFLVAFNSINQQNKYSYTSFSLEGGDADRRNVYVYAVEKNFSDSNQQVNKTTIANYENTKLYTSTPTLVKITNNQFVVLWQEYSEEGSIGNLKYVYVDGQGNITKPVTTLPNFKLSEVQPIVKDNKLIWFAIENSATSYKKVLYELSLN